MSTSEKPLVSMILPVLNGEKYIRQCLEAVLAQTEQNFKLVIIDDGSTDSTLEIIESLKIDCRKDLPQREKLVRQPADGNWKFRLVKNETRLAPWGNFERACRQSQSKYCVLLSVDGVIGKDFIKNAMTIMEADNQIGCLQAKIFQYEIGSDYKLQTTRLPAPDGAAYGGQGNYKLIDTVGFGIFKSRRVINIGHGLVDNDGAPH